MSVFPHLAAPDSPNGREVQANIFGDRSERPSVVKDHPNRFLVSARIAVPLSDHACGSSLREFIKVIVRVCAKPKMIWVDARRIIASVKDLHSLRDGTMIGEPRNAMRPVDFSVKAEGPISFVISGTAPDVAPAWVGLWQYIKGQLLFERAKPRRVFFGSHALLVA
jgi:hypothetical protein